MPGDASASAAIVISLQIDNLQQIDQLQKALQGIASFGDNARGAAVELSAEAGSAAMLTEVLSGATEQAAQYANAAEKTSAAVGGTADAADKAAQRVGQRFAPVIAGLVNTLEEFRDISADSGKELDKTIKGIFTGDAAGAAESFIKDIARTIGMSEDELAQGTEDMVMAVAKKLQLGTKDILGSLQLGKSTKDLLIGLGFDPVEAEDAGKRMSNALLSSVGNVVNTLKTELGGSIFDEATGQWGKAVQDAWKNAENGAEEVTVSLKDLADVSKKTFQSLGLPEGVGAGFVRIRKDAKNLSDAVFDLKGNLVFTSHDTDPLARELGAIGVKVKDIAASTDSTALLDRIFGKEFETHAKATLGILRDVNKLIESNLDIRKKTATVTADEQEAFVRAERAIQKYSETKIKGEERALYRLEQQKVIAGELSAQDTQFYDPLLGFKTSLPFVLNKLADIRKKAAETGVDLAAIKFSFGGQVFDAPAQKAAMFDLVSISDKWNTSIAKVSDTGKYTLGTMNQILDVEAMAIQNAKSEFEVRTQISEELALQVGETEANAKIQENLLREARAEYKMRADANGRTLFMAEEDLKLREKIAKVEVISLDNQEKTNKLIVDAIALDDNKYTENLANIKKLNAEMSIYRAGGHITDEAERAKWQQNRVEEEFRYKKVLTDEKEINNALKQQVIDQAGLVSKKTQAELARANAIAAIAKAEADASDSKIRAMKNELILNKSIAEIEEMAKNSIAGQIVAQQVLNDLAEKENKIRNAANRAVGKAPKPQEDPAVEQQRKIDAQRAAAEAEAARLNARMEEDARRSVNRQELALGGLNTRIQAFERELDAVFRAGFRLKMVGMDLRFAGDRALGFIDSAVQQFADFEWAAARAASTLGGFARTSKNSGDEFKQLQNVILDTSLELKMFSAEEIAMALYFLGSTTGQTVKGLSGLKDMMSQLVPIMKAAAMTNTDYETAIKGVYSVVSQFYPGLISLSNASNDYSLVTLKMTDVTEKLYFATQLTAAEFPDLINSFKMVGPVAAQAGAKFDDVAELLARLADIGIRGTMSGRGLRQMFIQMVRPSEQAKKALDELFSKASEYLPEFAGKSYSEIFFPGGKFEGTTNYIRDLAKALRVAGESYRGFILARIATANELPILTALVYDEMYAMQGLTGETSKLSGRMDEASKEFEAAWNRYQNTAKMALAALDRVNEAIRITIGSYFAEAIKPFIQNVYDALQLIRKWIMENQSLVTSIGKVVTIAAGFSVAAGAALIFAGSLVGLGAAIKLILSAFAPVVPTIGGGLGIIAGIVLSVIKRWDEVEATITRVYATFSDVTSGIRNDTDGVLESLQKMSSPLTSIADLIVSIFLAILDFFTTLRQNFGETVSTIGVTIASVTMLVLSFTKFGGILKIITTALGVLGISLTQNQQLIEFFGKSVSLYFGAKLAADISRFVGIAGFVGAKYEDRYVTTQRMGEGAMPTFVNTIERTKVRDNLLDRVRTRIGSIITPADASKTTKALGLVKLGVEGLTGAIGALAKSPIFWITVIIPIAMEAWNSMSIAMESYDTKLSKSIAKTNEMASAFGNMAQGAKDVATSLVDMLTYVDKLKSVPLSDVMSAAAAAPSEGGAFDALGSTGLYYASAAASIGESIVPPTEDKKYLQEKIYNALTGEIATLTGKDADQINKRLAAQREKWKQDNLQLLQDNYDATANSIDELGRDSESLRRKIPVPSIEQYTEVLMSTLPSEKKFIDDLVSKIEAAQSALDAGGLTDSETAVLEASLEENRAALAKRTEDMFYIADYYFKHLEGGFTPEEFKALQSELSKRGGDLQGLTYQQFIELFGGPGSQKKAADDYAQTTHDNFIKAAVSYFESITLGATDVSNAELISMLNSGLVRIKVGTGDNIEYVWKSAAHYTKETLMFMVEHGQADVWSPENLMPEFSRLSQSDDNVRAVRDGVIDIIARAGAEGLSLIGEDLEYTPMWDATLKPILNSITYRLAELTDRMRMIIADTITPAIDNFRKQLYSPQLLTDISLGRSGTTNMNLAKDALMNILKSSDKDTWKLMKDTYMAWIEDSFSMGIFSQADYDFAKELASKMVGDAVNKTAEAVTEPLKTIDQQFTDALERALALINLPETSLKSKLLPIIDRAIGILGVAGDTSRKNAISRAYAIPPVYAGPNGTVISEAVDGWQVYIEDTVRELASLDDAFIEAHPEIKTVINTLRTTDPLFLKLYDQLKLTQALEENARTAAERRTLGWNQGRSKPKISRWALGPGAGLDLPITIPTITPYMKEQAATSDMIKLASGVSLDYAESVGGFYSAQDEILKNLEIAARNLSQRAGMPELFPDVSELKTFEEKAKAYTLAIRLARIRIEELISQGMIDDLGQSAISQGIIADTQKRLSAVRDWAAARVIHGIGKPQKEILREYIKAMYAYYDLDERDVSGMMTYLVKPSANILISEASQLMIEGLASGKISYVRPENVSLGNNPYYTGIEYLLGPQQASDAADEVTSTIDARWQTFFAKITPPWQTALEQKYTDFISNLSEAARRSTPLAQSTSSFMENLFGNIYDNPTFMKNSSVAFDMLLVNLERYIAPGQSKSLRDLWEAGANLGEVLGSETWGSLIESFFQTAVDTGKWMPAEDPGKELARAAINQIINSFYSGLKDKKEWRQAIIDANKKGSMLKNFVSAMKTARQLGKITDNQAGSIAALTDPVISMATPLLEAFQFNHGDKWRSKAIKRIRESMRGQRKNVQRVIIEAAREQMDLGYITEEEFYRMFPDLKPKAPKKPKGKPLDLIEQWLSETVTGGEPGSQKGKGIQLAQDAIEQWFTGPTKPTDLAGKFIDILTTIGQAILPEETIAGYYEWGTSMAKAIIDGLKDGIMAIDSTGKWLSLLFPSDGSARPWDTNWNRGNGPAGGGGRGVNSELDNTNWRAVFNKASAKDITRGAVDAADVVKISKQANMGFITFKEALKVLRLIERNTPDRPINGSPLDVLEQWISPGSSSRNGRNARPWDRNWNRGNGPSGGGGRGRDSTLDNRNWRVVFNKAASKGLSSGSLKPKDVKELSSQVKDGFITFKEALKVLRLIEKPLGKNNKPLDVIEQWLRVEGKKNKPLDVIEQWLQTGVIPAIEDPTKWTDKKDTVITASTITVDTINVNSINVTDTAGKNSGKNTSQLGPMEDNAGIAPSSNQLRIAFNKLAGRTVASGNAKGRQINDIVHQIKQGFINYEQAIEILRILNRKHFPRGGSTANGKPLDVLEQWFGPGFKGSSFSEDIGRAIGEFLSNFITIKVVWSPDKKPSIYGATVNGKPTDVVEQWLGSWAPGQKPPSTVGANNAFDVLEQWFSPQKNGKASNIIEDIVLGFAGFLGDFITVSMKPSIYGSNANGKPLDVLEQWLGRGKPGKNPSSTVGANNAFDVLEQWFGTSSSGSNMINLSGVGSAIGDFLKNFVHIYKKLPLISGGDGPAGGPGKNPLKGIFSSEAAKAIISGSVKKGDVNALIKQLNKGNITYQQALDVLNRIKTNTDDTPKGKPGNGKPKDKEIAIHIKKVIVDTMEVSKIVLGTSKPKEEKTPPTNFVRPTHPPTNVTTSYVRPEGVPVDPLSPEGLLMSGLREQVVNWQKGKPERDKKYNLDKWMKTYLKDIFDLPSTWNYVRPEGVPVDPLSPEGLLMSGLREQVSKWLEGKPERDRPYNEKKRREARLMEKAIRKVFFMKHGYPSVQPKPLGPMEDLAGGIQSGLFGTSTKQTPSMYAHGAGKSAKQPSGLKFFEQLLNYAHRIGKRIPSIIFSEINGSRNWEEYGNSIGYAWGKGWSEGAKDGVNSALLSIKAVTVGNSPPKLGPLKTVDKGGHNIGKAWGGAFHAGAVDSVHRGAQEVKRTLDAQNREFAHRGSMDMSINRNDKKHIQISLNVTGDGSANRATMSELRKGLMDALIMADLEHMVEVI